MKKMFLPVVVLLMGAYFFWDQMKVKKFFSRLDQEFPTMHYSRVYTGEISRIQSLPYWIRSSDDYLYVIMKDSIKFSLHAGPELKSKQSIKEVVRVGDIIKKEVNSNAFAVLRSYRNDTLLFRFVLLDEANQPIK